MSNSLLIQSGPHKKFIPIPEEEGQTLVLKTDGTSSTGLSFGEETGGVTQQYVDDAISGLSGGHAAVSLSGTPDYLTLDEVTQTFTLNQVDLSTDVIGQLAGANLDAATQTSLASADSAVQPIEINTLAGLNAIVGDATLVDQTYVDSAVTAGGHDPVSLAGLGYITKDAAQGLTLGQIDLATDVTGALPGANLDAATQASLASADTAIQPGDIDTLAELNTIVGDATIADTSYVDSAVAAAVVGGMTYQGDYDASVAPSGTASTGDVYTVTVAGNGGGYFASSLDIGDVIIAKVDNPGLASDWTTVNKDVDHAAFVLTSDVNTLAGLNTIVGDATVADTTYVDSAVTAGSHDPVSLAGLDYITKDAAQGLTLGQIDLATDVTGALSGANLDAATQASLASADSALQAGDIDTLADLNAIVGDATLVDQTYVDTAAGNATGITNLSYIPSSTNGTVASDTGTDATLPLADGTNAGLMAPADFTKLGAYVPYIQNAAAIQTEGFTAVLGETHLIDTSSGGFTVDLPAIASGQGRIAFDFVGTGGQLTIDPAPPEQIEGKNSIKLAHGHNTIENDGTEWKVIQRSGKNPTRLDPAQITSNQDGYAPADWDHVVTHLYIDSDASREIQGFEENGFVDMDQIIVTNDGSNDIIIKHDTSTTATNKVLVDGGTDFILGPNQSGILMRDDDAGRWRFYGISRDPVTLVSTPSPDLDYITLSGQELDLGYIDLGTDVTGTLDAANIGSHTHTIADITDLTDYVTNPTASADSQVAVFTADGVVEGTANFTYDGSILDVKNGGTASSMKLYCEVGNAHFTELKSAPHANYTGGSKTFVLPAVDGSSGHVLQTDGAGNLSFVAPSGGGSGHTIEDEGVDLAQRGSLNFVGAGVTATDDAGNDRTIVTISGGGGGASTLEGLTDTTITNDVAGSATTGGTWSPDISGLTFTQSGEYGTAPYYVAADAFGPGQDATLSNYTGFWIISSGGPGDFFDTYVAQGPFHATDPTGSYSNNSGFTSTGTIDSFTPGVAGNVVDGYVLTWNDTGNTWEPAASAAGGGGTVQNVNLSIEPTDDGTVTGNARGANSVDLQTARSLATQVASGSRSTVGGGENNTANGTRSTVSGGYGNTASGDSSTIGGGFENTAIGERSTVGGGRENTASNYYSTISGGYNNDATAFNSTVGGGRDNTASSPASTVSGGINNDAIGTYSTVGGGDNNDATALNSTVSGGYKNIASGQHSTIGGGYGNTASGDSSTIGGGYLNTASGERSTIGGGIAAKADKYCQQAYSAGQFAAQGDAQTSLMVVRNQTSTATQGELFLNGASETQRMTIADDTTWFFEINLVARRTDANDESAIYKFEGAIDRNTGAATTTLVGTVAKTVYAEDTPAWDATVEADTTNGALVIKVTGEAAKTIRWVARVETTEVTG